MRAPIGLIFAACMAAIGFFATAQTSSAVPIAPAGQTGAIGQLQDNGLVQEIRHRRYYRPYYRYHYRPYYRRHYYRPYYRRHYYRPYYRHHYRPYYYRRHYYRPHYRHYYRPRYYHHHHHGWGWGHRRWHRW
ncbi:hypothetical protein [Labrys neptuniae]